MIEVRASIKCCNSTKSILEKVGAKKVADYEFEEVVYTDQGIDSYMKIRTYSTNPTDLLRFVIEQNGTDYKRNLKTPLYVRAIIQSDFENYTKTFNYSRQGSIYEFNESKVFVDEVTGIINNVKVESPTPQENNNILELLRAQSPINTDIVKVMHNYFKN